MNNSNPTSLCITFGCIYLSGVALQEINALLQKHPIDISNRYSHYFGIMFNGFILTCCGLTMARIYPES